MEEKEIATIVRERRAGVAARVLTSATNTTLSATDRLQLEAVALPLLSEEEIIKKWVGWLSSPQVPFSLLVQQLAKRLVSLPEQNRTTFAERLHKLLSEALQQGNVQHGAQEKPDDHKKIIEILKPHLLMLPAPRAEIIPPSLAKGGGKSLPWSASDRVGDLPRPSALPAKPATAPAPVGLPVEPTQPLSRRPVMIKSKPELMTLPDHPQLRNAVPARPMIDVRSPTLLGPLDELKTLDLEDFRRFGVTPDERAEKIRDMLKVAGHDGVINQRKALAAWIDSPLMQLQRAIGFAGLEGEQALAAEITRRLQAKQPTLSQEEFEALADLAEEL